MSIYFVPVQIWFPLQSKKYKKKGFFFLYFFVRLLVLTFVWQSALRHTSLWSFYFVFLFRFKKNCTFFCCFKFLIRSKFNLFDLAKLDVCFLDLKTNVKHKTRNIFCVIQKWWEQEDRHILGGCGVHLDSLLPYANLPRAYKS